MPNVVLAFDGSPQAQQAVERLQWLDARGLKVTVVCAVDGPAINDRGDAVDADPEQLQRAERDLAACCQRLQALGIGAETRIGVGEPATVIVDLAAALQADLIVTGSRGLSFAKRVLLGSTSAAIAARASCAVMIVR